MARKIREDLEGRYGPEYEHFLDKMLQVRHWLMEHVSREADRRAVLQALVDSGTISPEDMNLFQFCDDPQQAFNFLRDGLTKYHLPGASKPKAPRRLPNLRHSPRPRAISRFQPRRRRRFP